MEAWGGNDDWDFEFEPEILKQQPVKVTESEWFMSMVVMMEMLNDDHGDPEILKQQPVKASESE